MTFDSGELVFLLGSTIPTPRSGSGVFTVDDVPQDASKRHAKMAVVVEVIFIVLMFFCLFFRF